VQRTNLLHLAHVPARLTFLFPLQTEHATQAFAKPPVHPRGYWVVDGNKNIRKFFDDFAHCRNLDPLIPETWYNIRMSVFTQQKVCFYILKYKIVNTKGGSAVQRKDKETHSKYPNT
jgi:hypothetical protein